MDTIIIILLIAVMLLYLRWIFIILVYPLQALWGVYQKHKTPLTKLFAAPFYIVEHILGGVNRYTLYQIGTMPSIRLRKYLYRGLGVRMGKNVTFHFRTEIRSPFKLTVGKGTIIGDNALLDARMGLTMGDNVNISSNVSIYTLQHDHRAPDFSCPNPKDRKMSVEIGDRVWLGSNVLVLPGVTIGEGAVCCAGCVVTKDVEPYTVVAGIPAHKVGERPRNLTYEFKEHRGLL